MLIPDTHAESWIQLLRDFFGYRLYHSTHAFLQFDHPSSDFPPTDIMLVDWSTWEKLSAKAETRELRQETFVQLPHPMHLIAMKLKAVSSPHRRRGNSDWSDVVQLIQELKLSLDDEVFRSIILRYGSTKYPNDGVALRR